MSSFIAVHFMYGFRDNDLQLGNSLGISECNVVICFIFFNYNYEPFYQNTNDETIWFTTMLTQFKTEQGLVKKNISRKC